MKWLVVTKSLMANSLSHDYFKRYFSKTYFSDVSFSDTNEESNGLLKEFFLKKTDLAIGVWMSLCYDNLERYKISFLGNLRYDIC